VRHSRAFAQRIRAAISTNSPVVRLARAIAARAGSNAVVRCGKSAFAVIRMATAGHTPVLNASRDNYGINGMSDNIYAHDHGVASDLFAATGDGNLFQRVLRLRMTEHDNRSEEEINAENAQPAHPAHPDDEPESLFATVRPNIVQSIRAFRVQDLADEATKLGQHFLYAYLGQAQSKQEVLETIATSFLFPKHFGKNYDALYDSLTELVHKAGSQPGFVIVLEQLPIAQKFDKEGREVLLDVFRDAAEFWAERRVAFRVFYSFV
jgi:RNAse (barnase) inhibitor barstar